MDQVRHCILRALRCGVGENLHKLGDFAPLIRCVAGHDRMLDAMLDVVLKNRVLNLLERGPYCLDLVDYIDAVVCTENSDSDVLVV